MSTKIIVIVGVILALLLVSCKNSSKDSQFQIKNQPGQTNNQQLPSGHPPISGSGESSNPSGQTMSQPDIAPPPSAPNEGGLDLNGLEKVLPHGWKKTNPSSTMRLAQYKIPSAGGDPDEAECYVFYLGSAAGTIDANVERWYGQFTDQKDKATSKATSTGKLNITYAEVAGTMGGGMMGGTNNKSNYRLFAAIVETKAGPYFFKAVGPEKTIKAQRDAMKSWLSKAAAADAKEIEMH